ncbi:MAG: SUMF1/EgtB/PvdO family nonheme iron enzyme [Chitinispirillales bacterium]|jgi:formylglycine-generating enzyme required for sulfatase activity|nr:SUMF1/EgtB/PvdO family nonheme iron enzyme [Chitinispirillales bacterium]
MKILKLLIFLLFANKILMADCLCIDTEDKRPWWDSRDDLPRTTESKFVTARGWAPTKESATEKARQELEGQIINHLGGKEFLSENIATFSLQHGTIIVADCCNSDHYTVEIFAEIKKFNDKFEDINKAWNEARKRIKRGKESQKSALPNCNQTPHILKCIRDNQNSIREASIKAEQDSINDAIAKQDSIEREQRNLKLEISNINAQVSNLGEKYKSDGKTNSLISLFDLIERLNNISGKNKYPDLNQKISELSKRVNTLRNEVKSYYASDPPMVMVYTAPLDVVGSGYPNLTQIFVDTFSINKKYFVRGWQKPQESKYNRSINSEDSSYIFKSAAKEGFEYVCMVDYLKKDSRSYVLSAKLLDVETRRIFKNAGESNISNLEDHATVREAVKDIFTQIHSVPVTISEVKFADFDDNGNTVDQYGSKFYAAQLKYLKPRVVYGHKNWLHSDKIDFYVKILDQDSVLVSFPSSPKGYTYRDNISIEPNRSIDTVVLSGWDFTKGSDRTHGEYSHEIWYNDKMLNRSTFTIEGTKYDISKDEIEIEMVFVKGGKFKMGCTEEQGDDCNIDERLVRDVTLSDFYISKFPVTQKQWEKVTGITPRKLMFEVTRDQRDVPWGESDGNHPVVYVSWYHAVMFIDSLNKKTGKNYRLLTEAEWEYAARGGAKSRGYKYAGGDDADAVAWHRDNSKNRTQPAGRKAPNELGIYDMSGNVFEWVNDWYDTYEEYSETNPQGAPGDTKRRVFRGGNWSFDKNSCRVSYRGNNNPGLRRNGVGFRIAISPSQ